MREGDADLSQLLGSRGTHREIDARSAGAFEPFEEGVAVTIVHEGAHVGESRLQPVESLSDLDGLTRLAEAT